MPTIAVLGAGPGLGLAVARRFAQGGYRVVLVARRADALDEYTTLLASEGLRAETVVGDLSDLDHFPELAHRIREVGGDPDVIYFAPTGSGMTFSAASDLNVEAAESNSRLLFSAMVASVQQFLPHMLAQRSGAILTAQGATALSALAGMSGPGPAMAAQRHYLRSLGQEISPQGVSVGRLYIAGLIRHSAIDQAMRAARKPGQRELKIGLLEPNTLAEKLWKMRVGGRDREAVAPKGGRAIMPLMATKPARAMLRRAAPNEP